jgi:chromosome partitioning protein
MKIVTLLNEKGGVGKTTLATHIATGLAILGYRVILADADPQGHATVALGVNRTPGLYNLLVREESFRDNLQLVQPSTYEMPGRPVKGQLYVVPGNHETRAIPLMTSDGLIVMKRFAELQGYVDIVIFDTSPTPSLLHASIYMATHSILYPTECEFLSLDGLKQSLQHKDSIQPTREQWGLPTLEVMGIVPMKYRSSTVLHTHNLQSLQRYYAGKVWEPVSLGTIWGEASQRRRPVFHLAPESRASEEVWNVVTRVEKELA